jgi:hypothetical protein
MAATGELILLTYEYVLQVQQQCVVALSCPDNDCVYMPVLCVDELLYTNCASTLLWNFVLYTDAVAVEHCA